MNRLVEIRTADARESLDRIRTALKKARDRRSEAKELQSDLRNLFLSGKITDIESLVIYCTTILGVKSELNWAEFQTRAAKGQEAFNFVKDKLSRFLATTNRLTQGSSNGPQLDMHESKTEEVLSDKERKLNGITRAALKIAPAPTPMELLQSIEKAKPMWAEHIETVAGMVLRDDRFDDGLCALADGIVAICSKFSSKETLNILGRDSAVTKELNYAVYLRFPTWSVWGLPLVAHEFWHASCIEVSGLKEALSPPGDSTIWSDSLMQDCFADTFATYVMGPAYAFSCILLWLNVGSPEDRVRAKIVFSTLEHLARENPEYRSLDALKKCWAEAAAGEPIMDTMKIETLQQVLFQYIDEGKNSFPYSIKDWKAAGATLGDYLKREQEGNFTDEDIKSLKQKNVDLRHVLHSAWLERWRLSELDDKAFIERVRERAHQLCSKLLPPEKEKTALPPNDPGDPK